LGAVAGDIVRLVLRGSLAIAVTGIVIGQLSAVAFGRLVEPLLFNVSPRDPFVFVSVGLTLVTVALVATLIPALRARSVNPIEALRVE
jgi:ABC-type antimicrobial peptide transport system permease subunit